MTAGAKIQALRKSKGLTQEELASKLGVSRQAVSRWELNEVLPETGNLIQLSKIFGVSIDYLLDNQVKTEAELPLVQQTKRKVEKKSRLKLILLAIYLLAVLILFLVTRSVMIAYTALSFALSAYILYLVIRFLQKAIRKD